MNTNSEIYLIGFAILIFLIIVFLFIRKISNTGKLKVKIEPVPELFDEEIINKNQQSFEFETNEDNDQELVILNLISVDKTVFDMEQLFGFLSNYGGKISNKFFSFCDESNIEQFRVINALNPGTFEEGTQTFAVAIVSDINTVEDPLYAVKAMIEFSIDFTEKFHATLCDQERTPITKQMILHIETKAQDVARIKQLKNRSDK
jgi:FtsZ-interacting cell division protein ZipA